MRKLNLKILLSLIIINTIFISILFTVPSHGALEEIDPNFGKAPTIDGEIGSFANEWDEAYKIQTNLTDLPINLWVMQSSSRLYISVQFDLIVGIHSPTEFVGILISNSSSEDREDFIDAKIVQFSNITEDEFNYFDYFINQSVFIPDSASSGNGAAKLEGETSTYEFSIPINNPQVTIDEDVYLEYDEPFAFNITYGDTPSYPQGIKKSSIFLINIQHPPKSELPFLKLTIFILTILIFSLAVIIYGFYIYRIIKLKEIMERYRR